MIKTHAIAPMRPGPRTPTQPGEAAQDHATETGSVVAQVRKLEGFKKSLLSNLAEEAGTVLPAAASPEPLPDGDTLVNDVLAGAKPEALPARPSLVHFETRAHPALTPWNAPFFASAGVVTPTGARCADEIRGMTRCAAGSVRPNAHGAWCGPIPYRGALLTSVRDDWHEVSAARPPWCRRPPRRAR